MSDQQNVRITGPTIKALVMFLEHHPKQLSGADIINQKRILSGTLYPLLARLEGAKWLESSWEDVDPRNAGRPRKRLFRLTGLGVREATRELAAHNVFHTEGQRKRHRPQLARDLI